MYRKYLFAVVAMIFTVNCLLGSGCSDKVDEQHTVLNEECIVYKTVINDLYGDKIIALLDVTVPSDSQSTTEKKLIKENLGVLIEDITFVNYQINNRQSHDLDPGDCIDLRTIRLSEDERKQIFERGGGWSQFQSQHPDASKALMTFSKVGFNANLSQALIFVQRFGDYGTGDGLYIFLVKSNGVWSIQRKIVAWIA